jgi:hypothetical protein
MDFFDRLFMFIRYLHILMNNVYYNVLTLSLSFIESVLSLLCFFIVF